MPGLPEPWYGWPIGIDLGIALNPWQCVYRELFWEYTARTMTDALRMLFAYENRGLYLQYDFQAWEFDTDINWYVDWPLRRRGKEDAIYRRPGTGNVIPLVDHDIRDDTIFEVYNKSTDSAGHSQVFRLRVGGATRKETVENWLQVAKVIRRRGS
ncbi:MAG: hypothetical protein ABFS45_21065 [Pseudomonadota bacterium]